MYTFASVYPRRVAGSLRRFPAPNDLAQTAALMQALDLVVSARTAVSRLAAALGAPTWQLTCGAYWQTHGTSRRPQYPTMRRFVRERDQDWESVMECVAIELAKRTGA